MVRPLISNIILSKTLILFLLKFNSLKVDITILLCNTSEGIKDSLQFSKLSLLIPFYLLLYLFILVRILCSYVFESLYIVP